MIRKAVVGFVFLIFNVQSTFAATCLSATGTLTPANQSWVITYSQSAKDVYALPRLFAQFESQLEQWPCTELLVTRSDQLVLTIGLIDNAGARDQLNAWIAAPGSMIPRHSRLSSGAELADRVMGPEEFRQIQNTYLPHELVGHDVIYAGRQAPGPIRLSLRTDGTTTLNALDGSWGQSLTGRWTIEDDVLLCLYLPDQACARLELNGSGLLIRNAPGGNVAGDIYFWAKPDDLRTSYLVSHIPDAITDSVTILGRTLKDREAWQSTLYSDGSFEFRGSSGDLSYGRFWTGGGRVCYLFDGSATEICRYPDPQLTGQVLWAGNPDKAPISEIVGIIARDPDRSPSATARRSVTVILPDEAAPQPPISAQRPPTSGICERPASFCADFVNKTTLCGFAAQAASDAAIGYDTGATGGVASGLACTTLLSDLEGIGVDVGDLALAALGGVAGSAAGEAIKERDSNAFLGAVTLFGGTYFIARQKCEAAVRQACNR